MSTKKPTLAADELARLFVAELAAKYPPVMSPKQLAELPGKSPKTVYDWMARGRLDGAYRKRGKHALIWRYKALEILGSASVWRRILFLSFRPVDQLDQLLVTPDVIRYPGLERRRHP